ncbi:TetR/AcrR family transcriptional regulator [Sporanaerobacter sp. PP17-6a]|uniref:TetR/AcrR family transcriptional regulator n=1 Tax=Sporanaerobacter sp. PP17-6a TaxID=1891289 RepID=UPI0008A06099|nr:TetR/AcrR family transcriptional regulator [Sporanaerobacter sp. PP17-6a]SCL91840.1 Transcriptional regulator AcuR [Sporanaerobacter sp. PP17-6a]
MSRIVKPPDIRKQELIDIALKQFLEKGYERTSVRSILKEANGEIGMFYHYFESKNEIYEAALEKYNKKYIDKVDKIIKDPVLSFEEKLDCIFEGLSESLLEHSLMYTEKTNPDIMSILHSMTLKKMIPLFEELLIEGVKEKKLHTPLSDIHQLTGFLLFGVSAIIHDDTEDDMNIKGRNIKLLLNKILDTKV